MTLTVGQLVDQVQLFFLIFLRVASIFVETPFIGSRLIPMQVRGAIAFMVALISFPVVAGAGYSFPNGDFSALAFAALNEIAIGLALGFIANLYMMVFQLAGQFFSVQLGFGIIEVMDPMAEVSLPVVGQLQNLFATLVFIAIDGHRYLLEAVIRSFSLCPTLGGAVSGNMLYSVADTMRILFEIAFVLAAPVMGTVFVVEVALGILNRAAPAMNVMMLGFPVKIVFGLLVLVAAMPQIAALTERVFVLLFEDATRFMRVMAG